MIRRITLTLLFLGVLGTGAVYFLFFPECNRVVQEKFQGHLWELPARVYARPMEIYNGMALVPDILEQELNLMHYKRVQNPVDLDLPGKYIRSGQAIDIFRRPFDFGDEKTNSGRIQFKIHEQKVSSLTYDGQAPKEDMVRLDPVIIGSFYPASMEDRILLELKHLPPLLPRTIIGVEDRSFYIHYGVNLLSVARAMWVNLKSKRMTQGASTITQQLARNFFFTSEKTLKRKINELFMAVALEINYGKEEILEAYINEIFLGQDGNRAVHGFGLGSVFYFGKPVRDLKAHEVALLVGLLKGPSYYNPRKYPERAMKRRNIVLKLMEQQQIISRPDMEKALKTPLGILEKPIKGNSPFPAYLDLVKRQLLKEYRESDIKSMGLRIFTPLDPQVQLSAEKGAKDQLKQIARRKGLPLGPLELSVVVTATAGNEIQALVGGKDPGYTGFNRALDARRPIGSLIKPAVYLSALSRPSTYTLITHVNDGPIKVSNSDGSKWTPRNYDRKYHGRINLYKAMVNSYNASTVRIGMDVGLPAVSDTLEKMGFKSTTPFYPSTLLGSLEMSAYEVAQIYHTLSSGGFFTPARSIRTVFKPNRERVQRYPLTLSQQLDPGAVFLLNKILQAVVMEGTARGLKKWFPRDLGIAGKTGTSNDLKDSWFAGFTGNRLAVVWVGRDDNRPAKLTGSQGAMQIFGQFMSKLPQNPLILSAPENVVWEIIDPKTGLLADEDCSGAMVVPFVKGSSPGESSPCMKSGLAVTVSEKILEKIKKKSKKSRKSQQIFNWTKESTR